MVKMLLANIRGFHPWVGKMPWKRKWQSTQIFLPGKSREQRNLTGDSAWGCKRVRQDLPTKTTILYIPGPFKVWVRSRYSVFLFLHDGVLDVNFSAKKLINYLFTRSPEFQADSLPSEPRGKPIINI